MFSPKYSYWYIQFIPIPLIRLIRLIFDKFVYGLHCLLIAYPITAQLNNILWVIKCNDIIIIIMKFNIYGTYLVIRKSAQAQFQLFTIGLNLFFQIII